MPECRPWMSGSPASQDPSRQQLCTSRVDPIAIGVWSQGNGPAAVAYLTSSLDDVPAGPGPTFEHVSKALKIREYFEHKMLMAAFAETKMTPFRKDLMKFLTRPVNEYSMDEIGMICRLPTLYDEDQVLDLLREDYDNSEWREDEPNGLFADLTLTLVNSHIKKGSRYSRSKYDGAYICYWFHDESQRLYLIEMDTKCPFRNMWQELITHSVDITGKAQQHNGRSGLKYYTLPQWEILDK